MPTFFITKKRHLRVAPGSDSHIGPGMQQETRGLAPPHREGWESATHMEYQSRGVAPAATTPGAEQYLKPEFCATPMGSDSTCGTSSPSPRVRTSDTVDLGITGGGIRADGSWANNESFGRVRRRSSMASEAGQAGCSDRDQPDSRGAAAGSEVSDGRKSIWFEFDSPPHGSSQESSAGGRELHRRKCKFRIFVVFRGDWCDTSRVLLKGFVDLNPHIKRAGGKVVAISSQAPEQVARAARDFQLPFQAFSDPTNGLVSEMNRRFNLDCTISQNEMVTVACPHGMAQPCIVAVYTDDKQDENSVLYKWTRWQTIGTAKHGQAWAQILAALSRKESPAARATGVDRATSSALYAPTAAMGPSRPPRIRSRATSIGSGAESPVAGAIGAAASAGSNYGGQGAFLTSPHGRVMPTHGRALTIDEAVEEALKVGKPRRTGAPPRTEPGAFASGGWEPPPGRRSSLTGQAPRSAAPSAPTPREWRYSPRGSGGGRYDGSSGTPTSSATGQSVENGAVPGRTTPRGEGRPPAPGGARRHGGGLPRAGGGAGGTARHARTASGARDASPSHAAATAATRGGGSGGDASAPKQKQPGTPRGGRMLSARRLWSRGSSKGGLSSFDASATDFDGVGVDDRRASAVPPSPSHGSRWPFSKRSEVGGPRSGTPQPFSEAKVAAGTPRAGREGFW